MQIRSYRVQSRALSGKDVNKLYYILGALTAAAAVKELLVFNYRSILHCAVAAVLFCSVRLIKRTGLSLPKALEGSILIFIFMSQVIGEAECGYIKYRQLDSALHILSGAILSAFGFALPEIFAKDGKGKVKPILAAVFAFCFSVSAGVFWELFEFSADRLLKLDMQKDTVIREFASVEFDESDSNVPIRIEEISETAINDGDVVIDGYLDIGLFDTMKDFMMNIAGAGLLCFTGAFADESNMLSAAFKAFVPKISAESKTGC